MVDLKPVIAAGAVLFAALSGGTLVATLGACAESTEPVGPPLAAGLDSEEPELAEFLVSRVEAARLDLTSGLARGRLGMAYDANGFDDAAAETYAHAELLDPADFRWPYLRALLLADSGQQDAAIAALDSALAIDAGYAPAWLWRGTWMLESDRNAEAERSFRKALSLVEVDAATIERAAIAGLARALLASGRPDDALTLLEPVVEDYPHPQLMRILSRGYRAVGRPDDARRAAASGRVGGAVEWDDERRAELQGDVRGFSGRLALAEQLLNREPDAALPILRDLRVQRPDDRTVLNNLAVAFNLTHRPDDAFKVFFDALELHDDYYLLHFNLAAAYEEAGDIERALDHFDRALELQPSMVSAHERKVALLIQRNRYVEALAAIDESGRHGEQPPGMLLYAGIIEGFNERWPLAIERFEQAVALDPDFGKGYLYLGRSLAEALRFDEARAAFDRAEALGTPKQALDDARQRLVNLESERDRG